MVRNNSVALVILSLLRNIILTRFVNSFCYINFNIVTFGNYIVCICRPYPLIYFFPVFIYSQEPIASFFFTVIGKNFNARFLREFCRSVIISCVDIKNDINQIIFRVISIFNVVCNNWCALCSQSFRLRTIIRSFET